MDALHLIVSNVETVVAMTPGELANVILEAIRRRPREDHVYHRQNIRFSDCHQDDEAEVADAISAAWHWMSNQGLLYPHQDHGWQKLSPYGKQLLASHLVDAGALPEPISRHLLHPLVVLDAEPEHLRGQHDKSVFAALRRLEIVVREASGAAEIQRGADLMRFAFDPHKGPLSDLGLPTAERENESHLFAGAMGTFRNATGHRDLKLGPVETSQILIFVSMLLSIVDVRKAAR